MSINSEARAAARDRLGALAAEADLVALHRQAVRAGVDVVERATAADLARPTPCAGWTLRDLLAHMTTQNHGFAAASRGESDPALWVPRPGGGHPVDDYRASARQVLDAFAAPDILDRAFPLPELAANEPFPGTQAVAFHLIDYVVHSWDVARTLDVPVVLAPDLLDAALVVARLVPGGGARLVPGAAFAPRVPFGGGARLDEIVALLGRSPDWPA